MLRLTAQHDGIRKIDLTAALFSAHWPAVILRSGSNQKSCSTIGRNSMGGDLTAGSQKRFFGRKSADAAQTSAEMMHMAHILKKSNAATKNRFMSSS